eukprot:CAMPEP_0176093840 /NCGR_PEP_ID=MMETSP0120_2-20121206/47021_1 /TAXON_ID=160619 /ORGANISM="Kryptoperidinium foliaceum, Strain CCMP 1326" /LENGTH=75 /DNA_ID=CAMNT_0017427775 /DNA_START=135 /DNA_END=359 /DNA_ORIENTATION=-
MAVSTHCEQGATRTHLRITLNFESTIQKERACPGQDRDTDSVADGANADAHVSTVRGRAGSELGGQAACDRGLQK